MVWFGRELGKGKRRKKGRLERDRRSAGREARATHVIEVGRQTGNRQVVDCACADARASDGMSVGQWAI